MVLGNFNLKSHDWFRSDGNVKCDFCKLVDYARGWSLLGYGLLTTGLPCLVLPKIKIQRLIKSFLCNVFVLENC